MTPEQIIFVVIAIVVFGFVLEAYHFLRSRHEKSTSDAAAAQQPVTLPHLLAVQSSVSALGEKISTVQAVANVGGAIAKAVSDAHESIRQAVSAAHDSISKKVADAHAEVKDLKAKVEKSEADRNADKKPGNDAAKEALPTEKKPEPAKA